MFARFLHLLGGRLLQCEPSRPLAQLVLQKVLFALDIVGAVALDHVTLDTVAVWHAFGRVGEPGCDDGGGWLGQSLDQLGACVNLPVPKGVFPEQFAHEAKCPQVVVAAAPYPDGRRVVRVGRLVEQAITLRVGEAPHRGLAARFGESLCARTIQEAVGRAQELGSF